MAKGMTNRNQSEPAAWGGDQRLRLVGLAREEQQDLLSTIHDRLIPQLVLAHLEESLATTLCPDVRGPPTELEIQAFARLAVLQDLPAALEFVDALGKEGISLEVLLLHLLAPAARLLGDQWLADDTSFAEVTMGLSTIQRAVHVLGPSFAPLSPHRGLVVLTSMPGEYHSLGLYLLGEFLRREGWGVQISPNMDASDVVSLVETQHVEVVGLSVSNHELLLPLGVMVKAIRQSTMNPKMRIMLGGSPELNLAAYAAELGVTHCGGPLEAVHWLEHKDCVTLSCY